MTAAGRFGDLRTRLIGGIAVAMIALTCIWLGGVWIAGLASLAGGLMMAEWRRITAGADLPMIRGAAYIAAVAQAPVTAWAADWQIATFLLITLTLIGGILDRMAGRQGLIHWALLGAFYIGFAALAFVELRAVAPYGFLSILWAALIVVAADVGGYFAGRTIGGPKLWPAVSPKKTWAGLGGAVVLAFLVGGVFSWLTTGTYFHIVCAVSAVAALLAQAGDLGESALKRHFGVKDAGTLIPGHGGLLDRLDGHMAAVLVAAGATFWRGEAVFVW